MAFLFILPLFPYTLFSVVPSKWFWCVFVCVMFTWSWSWSDHHSRAPHQYKHCASFSLWKQLCKGPPIHNEIALLNLRRYYNICVRSKSIGCVDCFSRSSLSLSLFDRGLFYLRRLSVRKRFTLIRILRSLKRWKTIKRAMQRTRKRRGNEERKKKTPSTKHFIYREKNWNQNVMCACVCEV